MAHLGWRSRGVRGAEETLKRQAPVSTECSAGCSCCCTYNSPAYSSPHQTRHAGPEGVHCHPGLGPQGSARLTWRQSIPLGVGVSSSVDTEGVSQAWIGGGAGLWDRCSVLSGPRQDPGTLVVALCTSASCVVICVGGEIISCGGGVALSAPSASVLRLWLKYLITL